DAFHLFQPRLGNLLSVFFPVIAIKEFQRQSAIETDIAQDLQDGLERRDAVAGVHALGVGDVLARRIGGIVVVMNDVKGFAAEEAQAVGIGTTFVHVVDIGQNAGLGMAALDSHQSGFA